MLLKTDEIVAETKRQQTEKVMALRQAKVFPTLAIVQAGDNATSEAFLKVKQRYGSDVGANVTLHKVKSDAVAKTVKKLNESEYVHGIVVQLPLPEEVNVDAVLNKIDAKKDVDGLTTGSTFESPTTTAIRRLLEHYGVELAGKQIAVVGQGRLVGKPITDWLRKSAIIPKTYDEQTKELAEKLIKADVIIAATGQAGLIKDKMVKNGAIVIDAGTAEAGGKTVGDVDPALYRRNNIKVSPVPGGVGPLTVAALFDNLLQAAKAV